MTLFLVLLACLPIVIWEYFREKREQKEFRRRVTINLAVWLSGLGTIIPVGRRFEKSNHRQQLRAPDICGEHRA